MDSNILGMLGSHDPIVKKTALQNLILDDDITTKKEIIKKSSLFITMLHDRERGVRKDALALLRNTIKTSIVAPTSELYSEVEKIKEILHLSITKETEEYYRDNKNLLELIRQYIGKKKLELEKKKEKIESGGDVVIIYPIGILNKETLHIFEEALLALIQSKEKFLMIDLSKTLSITSDIEFFINNFIKDFQDVSGLVVFSNTPKKFKSFYDFEKRTGDFYPFHDFKKGKDFQVKISQFILKQTLEDGFAFFVLEEKRRQEEKRKQDEQMHRQEDQEKNTIRLTFEIEIFPEDSIAVVKISGALDIKTLDTFKNEMKALSKQGIKNIILNFANMKYVSSSGLGSLVKLSDTLETAGGSLSIVDIPKKISVIFNMLGLQSLLRVYISSKEAIDFIKSKERISKFPAPTSGFRAPAPKRKPSIKPAPSPMKTPAPPPPPPPPPPMAPAPPPPLPPRPAPAPPAISPPRGTAGGAAAPPPPEPVGAPVSRRRSTTKPGVIAPEKPPELKEIDRIITPSKGKSLAKKKIEEKLPLHREEKRGKREKALVSEHDERKKISEEKKKLKIDFLFGRRDEEDKISPEMKGVKWEVLEQLYQKPEGYVVRDIPKFEKALSDDAVNPGPVERIIAQSKIIMQCLQITIGLKFLILANVFDIIIEAFTGYIHGIFHAWKMSKTIKRRVERNDPQKQVFALADDLTIAKLQIARLFSLNNFSLFRNMGYIPESDKWEKYSRASFALKLVIETRGHLDEMKRDLALINAKQMTKFVKNSLKDFVISFIPNPVDFIPPWRDIFIVSFFMKYSQTEVKEMYVDFVKGYEKILASIIQNQREQQNDIRIKTYHLPWEHDITLSYTLSQDDSTLDEDETIEATRKRTQRLIQMLCNCEKIINPAKWDHFDLVMETKNSKTCTLLCKMELDKWLMKVVAREMQKKQMKVTTKERMRRLHEKSDFYKRYRIEKKLSQMFI